MKYPIGIQSFDQLREDGYVYIDKTDLVYSLVTAPAPFREEPFGLDVGALFFGAQGTVQGVEDRQPGKGLAGIPGVPYRFQWG